MKILALITTLLLLPFWSSADCTLTNTAKVPLPEMAFDRYQSFAGGLYPNFANQPPASHLAAGLDLATNEVKPLDASGNADANNGKIVLLSIGLSNTTQEWASKGTENFRAIANGDPAKNSRVLIVDGAQGGQASTDWTNSASPTWTTVEQRLSAASATTNQVQVIWLKSARRQPATSGAFPLHAQALQNDLEIMIRECRRRYPNLKIAYVSSRTRAYENTPTALNPEPFAYEAGFSTKWLIEKQINGAAELNFDPAHGAVVSPWLAWGPYLWSDGLVLRSDDSLWLCSDLENDFTHPNATGGVPKVARQLLAFFKTDPTTTPWFLRNTTVGQPPNCSATADATNGIAPLTVNFSASASDPDGTIRDYFWTFDDGTFATNASPKKVFQTPGTYAARLTVTDNSGNTVKRSIPINVVAVSLGTPSIVGTQWQMPVAAMTNYDCVVLQSSDLSAWTPVFTNRGSFEFSTSIETGSVARYFRAMLQP
ncbi:MAG: PKD domain-containing protein [Verrucomicrobiota bacterium]